jgi:hypothetical protein
MGLPAKIIVGGYQTLVAFTIFLLLETTYTDESPRVSPTHTAAPPRIRRSQTIHHRTTDTITITASYPPPSRIRWIRYDTIDEPRRDTPDPTNPTIPHRKNRST